MLPRLQPGTKSDCVTESSLDVGDRVLVRSVRLRGKHKLADKWEETVHVVVSRKADLPVYTVKPENKDGPLRTLHRDLLLPCGFLPASGEEPTAVSDKPSMPRTRQHPSSDPDEQETVMIRLWFSHSPACLPDHSQLTQPPSPVFPLYQSSPPKHSLPDCLLCFTVLSRDSDPDLPPILPVL